MCLLLNNVYKEAIMVYADPEHKERLIKLRLQDGQTYRNLSDEFGISEGFQYPKAELIILQT